MTVFLVSGRWADNCRNEKKNSVELPINSNNNFTKTKEWAKLEMKTKNKIK